METRWQPGKNEQAVRSTLPSRPAGLIATADNAVQSCFAALFSGAQRGIIFKPGQKPSFGKAEAEWAWPDGWNELRRLGLVTWVETETPCHPSFGDVPPMVEIDWQITKRGLEVRDDDLKWFREIMDARDRDAADRND